MDEESKGTNADDLCDYRSILDSSLGVRACWCSVSALDDDYGLSSLS